jgi:tRNA threonylcarbamoyladenosine biosynthesis protein TsaB
VNLLGLDTSTAAAAACVLRADGEAFEELPDPAALGRPPAHASELMPAVARVMERAGLDWPELDAVAVGVGPGSFTGLRIGVATARALARASGLRLRPVSSLTALAEGIDTGSDSVVLPLIDAKRGELFAAAYERGRELWAPFAARPEEVARRVREAGLAPLAAGDGSIRFRRVLEAAGIRIAPDGSDAHVVRALHVCRLAATAPSEPPEAVVPEYLRAPDAKPHLRPPDGKPQ